MADLADVNLWPRVGPYLSENIKDQSRLSKTVIIKKPSAIIDIMKNVIAKNMDIEAKIDANHALSTYGLREDCYWNRLTRKRYQRL